MDKAIGYGIEGHTSDGTDLAACLKVVREAVNRARNGCGPQMVVARLLRLCGHGEHDDSSYVDPKLKQSPIGRDCVKVAEEHLLQQRWADALGLFEAALALWQGDGPARTMADRCQIYQKTPPPEEWDGVFEALHK